MLSDKEKLDIEKDVKRLLESFGEKLDSVKAKELERVNSENSYRQEENEFKENLSFRTQILKNAPNSDKECIIAEKASWN